MAVLGLLIFFPHGRGCKFLFLYYARASPGIINGSALRELIACPSFGILGVLFWYPIDRGVLDN